MKKILLSIFLLITLCSSFAQIPFNGSLLIKSGLKKNTIVYGADTLKFGWESGSVFSISKANGQRLAKFSMNDSSTIIYNKLILQSPNDTMLSVRGSAYIQNLLTTKNIVVADSLMYNTFAIDLIFDTTAITTLHNANFQSSSSPSYDYFIDDAVSEFKFNKGDIVNIYDTVNNHTYINILIDSAYVNKGSVFYNIAPNTFINCCGNFGYVEKVDVDVNYDTISIMKVTDLLIAESIVVGDSVLVINSADSTSVFNGNVFINDTLVFSDNSKQWTAWIPNVSDTGFVKTIGDTMYGDLTILGSDLLTENIVVSDSLLYNTQSIQTIPDTVSTELHDVAIESYGVFYKNNSSLEIYKAGDVVSIYDTVNSVTYSSKIISSTYKSSGTLYYVVQDAVFITGNGYVERLDITNTYDTIEEVEIVGDLNVIGVDTIFSVNTIDNTSTFTGNVIMQNPTDTMLSVRGTSRFNEGMFPQEHITLLNTTNAVHSGVIYKGTSRFFHDFNYGNNGVVTTEGYNTFVGLNSGNLTMGATATNVRHSSYNVGLGFVSLTNNTTGQENTAIGSYSLANNSTGYSNTAVGTWSLYENTTGNNNTVLGVGAGSLNKTGSNNLFLGYNAGYWGSEWNNKGFIDVIDRGDSASQLTSSPIVIDFNADSSLQKTTFNSSVTVNDTAYLSTTTISGRLNVINAADTAVVVNGNLKADTIFGVTQMPFQSYVVKLTENLQWANSGPLVVGETYRIDALNAGDDFSNVGYMMPEMSFVATGTTPTNWSNGTYILNVTQSNPIVTVLYNSIGNVAWKYSGAKGSYRATFSESYDINKIAIFPAIPTLPPLQVITQGLTTYEGVGFFLNSYLIDASLNSYQADGVFTDYMFEVRIYP
ncbi:hypothetical protein SDC9_55316 [bioreactor metagenome]|uniref:Uncharacterized protein n=1 Tax=bioreactor metagenome TaxID=1076179 RepID=A0A644WYL0_9ZZZZ